MKFRINSTTEKKNGRTDDLKKYEKRNKPDQKDKILKNNRMV